MKKIKGAIALFVISYTSSGQAINDSIKKWSYHFQLTAINQSHPAFKAKYSGGNSLSNEAENNALSITTTLFAGRLID